MVMDTWASALGLDLRALPPFLDLLARATAPQPQGHLCAWPPCSCGCTAGAAVCGRPASGIPAFSAPVPFQASSTPLPSLLPSSSGLGVCPVQMGCLAIFLPSPISRDQAPPLGEVMPHECCPGQFVRCPPASRLQVQLLAKQPVVETGAGSWAAALHRQPGHC